MAVVELVVTQAVVAQYQVAEVVPMVTLVQSILVVVEVVVVQVDPTVPEVQE
jgi:hypothetical protein